MAHASLLDVWNAGARLGSQALDTLSKEKEYELDAAAYGAGLKLDTEMYKILRDTQHSNNPEELRKTFQNKIQEWKNTVAYPGGNNSQYYLDKITTMSNQAGETFEKKLYDQTLLNGNQRAFTLLATNLDNTYAAEDDPENPDGKLFRGLALIQDAFDHDIINPIEKRKEELTWANRIISNKLQTISDAAENPAELRTALDAVSAGAYAGYIAGQDIDRAREDAYRQGLNRIQAYNQQTLRDMEAGFQEKYKALQSGETAAYTNALNGLTRQINSGAITEGQYRSGLERLQQQYMAGGFQDTALLRETTALADAGKAFRTAAGNDGLRDALATAGYFEMEDRNTLLERTRTGAAGGAAGSGGAFNFDDLAFGVYAQSTQRPGESEGWTFNGAVEGAVSMAEARGFFENDDDAGTERQLFRARAVYEIGTKLARYADSNNLAGENNYFAKIQNETKLFLDTRKAAAILGKTEKNVTGAELQKLQGDLWNSVMNMVAEVGTAPENRAILEARIGALYETYTHDKYKILRDNAQSGSSALNDATKTAEALRLIHENPAIYAEGHAGDDGFGENIDDTARAYMNTGLNLLVNALGWPNDGRTYTDVTGRAVIAARGNEKYRIIGEKRNNRETLVVQKQITADGAKKWEDAEDIHIDSRNWRNRFEDLRRSSDNPLTRKTPWYERRNTLDGGVAGQGFQGAR
ncbi:MAG: hypothetical protein LBB83_01530 [Treponema sp.]|jgi:hypothetical protein|nr:hypothetical protein [Treponema sp.]